MVEIGDYGENDELEGGLIDWDSLVDKMWSPEERQKYLDGIPDLGLFDAAVCLVSCNNCIVLDV